VRLAIQAQFQGLVRAEFQAPQGEVPGEPQHPERLADDFSGMAQEALEALARGGADVFSPHQEESMPRAR
jgi:hypothetical protein